MRLCQIWNAGASAMLDRWEVSQRGRHGETVIRCRVCGWSGPCGLVAECGKCASRYVRLAERVRPGVGVKDAV